MLPNGLEVADMPEMVEEAVMSDCMRSGGGGERRFDWLLASGGEERVSSGEVGGKGDSRDSSGSSVDAMLVGWPRWPGCGDGWRGGDVGVGGGRVHCPADNDALGCVFSCRARRQEGTLFDHLWKGRLSLVKHVRNGGIVAVQKVG